MPAPYKSAGRCIYCGSRIYSEEEPERKLGDEHVVPLGFRGTDLLPDASCGECERTTSQIEDHCIRHLLKFARPHLGMRGRKSKKAPDAGLFTGGPGSGARKVPISDHPGYMIDCTYPYPRFLSGFGPADPAKDIGVHMRPIVPDFKDRVMKLGGTIGIKLGDIGSVEIYARLLAKIAHAYAAAELGIDNFEPWLPPIILEKPSRFGVYDLIGTSMFDDRPIGELHEVRFAPDVARNNELVVQIRLFANVHAPARSHYVVVGKPA